MLLLCMLQLNSRPCGEARRLRSSAAVKILLNDWRDGLDFRAQFLLNAIPAPTSEEPSDQALHNKVQLHDRALQESALPKNNNCKKVVILGDGSRCISDAILTN